MAQQPINYVPQGGFGGLNRASFVGSAQGIAKNLAAFKQQRDLSDFKAGLGQALKTGQGADALMAQFPQYQREIQRAVGFQAGQAQLEEKKGMRTTLTLGLLTLLVLIKVLFYMLRIMRNHLW